MYLYLLFLFIFFFMQIKGSGVMLMQSVNHFAKNILYETE